MFRVPNLFLIFVFTIIFSHGVAADIIILIDASPELAGKQDSRSIFAGQQFDVAVRMQLSDTDSLAGYAFRVRYDADELTLLNKEQFPPEGFVAADDNNDRSGNDDPLLGSGSNYMETQVGAVDLSFVAEPIRGPELFDVALLTFQANEAINDGLDLVTLFHPVFDGMFDANLETVPESSIRFGSASINAIPEPTVIGLLSLGILLAPIRRRRR